MKTWKLRYELQYDFHAPVTSHVYSLRCFPAETDTQIVHTCNYEIFPGSVQSTGVDSFGNRLLMGRAEAPHREFKVCVKAEISTWNYLEKEEKPDYQLGMYRVPTGLTAPGRKIEEFYRSYPQDRKPNPWQTAEEWMYRIGSAFSYLKNSTGITTTAESAFEQGYGVCQDYAHIMLALCRRSGLTARYQIGAIPGEGESHAWVEVLWNGFWKGFDPTNQKLTDESYIRFACGRDAGDCSLSRGVFRGDPCHSQHILLIMEEQVL
ncbi:MAG: transglutaminase family protein [Lachnospiraceae bacterium]|nr:transglutaminase family protein [Lachnospiraceae bacterium]